MGSYNDTYHTQRATCQWCLALDGQPRINTGNNAKPQMGHAMYFSSMGPVAACQEANENRARAAKGQA